MKRNEKGIALVITLFLMATLSALAVSMMFLAQTETAASRNYRTMSQARYAAEGGVHAMANYLTSSAYTAIAPVAVPTAGYGDSKVPVTCTAGCTHSNATGTCDGSTVANAVSTGCIVIGYSAATSNNPAGTTNAGATGTLAMNSSGTTTNAAAGTATYGAAAILMSMKQIDAYGVGPKVILTWQIISDGTVPPSTSAIVEVSSTVEQEVNPSDAYAVFATNPQCGAITISGNASTNSYTSGGPTFPPPTTNTGGGIGTNGNLNVSGSVNIGGTLTTPRTGAGTCSNSNVNAITGNGSWTYGGTDQVSQSVIYPAPIVPTGAGTNPVQISSGDTGAQCLSKVSSMGWLCSISGHQVTLYPSPVATGLQNTLTFGNLSVGSNTDLVIAGKGPTTTTAITDVVLNVNSFSIGNNATFSLADGSLPSLPKANVLMNIEGQNLGSTKPLDLSGGGSVNTNSGITGTSGYDPSRFQILYAGSGEIDMVGHNSISAALYAPNAYVKTTGNGTLYGAILGSKFEDTGGATINFDSKLTTKFLTPGNYMLTSFSWKKY